MSAALTHLASTGSTNDWLLANAAALADGHWVIADRQTAGRGRRGRIWGDGEGNLMTSVLVRAEGPVQQLSFVAALALRVALDLGDRVQLKWPNDLLLDGVKVSGILLERAGDALVVGMGVNLARHPDDTERPATSLAAAGLPVPAPMAVLARLMPAFAEYRGLWATQGFAPIRERWLAHAGGVGDRIAARLGAETIEGRFEGLAADGALALRLDDGSLRPVHAGEVFAL
ncbi:biotin--[acetyl-CoA-carboxylase] ligase [Polymorphobacter fuscus]|uniref:biotin--[biotin carboxyl-carrier protein] ligase n=1 Tax=Sandarakinorhabdus fusca TaxID=1439888 RepID=A0A7C9KG99_9SPHN|nr:biotin--[acetyl-CoA-carboxylase] ligase [Polymorphobacter fuscus]KAB7648403.1 biotin--[acetyl-CoA-carboxylase] ligase [Polymorphobacter fuscus]MQT15920.1 biotin--[acetyl-CoA-carboxylase] ligase [Polymorphobacter fuscus]NJC07804.1 BirA family biotin operon repressor/biotin-[acetyl-CoA-carboxylase] ligase [Polymorphobacter fuscus]